VQKIKSVGIKKLKNSLSAYIREVRSGNVILVTDHGRVVAELRSPRESHQQLEVERIMQQWVDADKLILPVGSRKNVPSSPVTLQEGTAAQLLERERGEHQ
jgi:prevent-host-death family protein